MDIYYIILLCLTLFILFWIIVGEISIPLIIEEGFDQLVRVGDTKFWAKWIPRSCIVGIDPTEEESGYIRNQKYFAGYTDLQHLGTKQDFCRMVQAEGDPLDNFFACAFGGAEGLSTVRYRSPSTKQGFKISRDDYMNSINGSVGYCRILKQNGEFEAMCNVAQPTKFSEKMLYDKDPPSEIETLLEFYKGIMFWLRLRDDMEDYAQNIIIRKAGNIIIDEIPKPKITKGLRFNGVDQYLRIGDNDKLEFGNSVDLTTLRAICVWVYFDEFTNNAHIFDFGNGQTDDNVWLGIMGRGNPTIQDNIIQETGCISEHTKTLPTGRSGQQCIDEVSPQELMKQSKENVNEFICTGTQVVLKEPEVIFEKEIQTEHAVMANLVYEIWEKQNYKFNVMVQNAIRLKKWTHIVITASSMKERPSLDFYINGIKKHTEEAGWLPRNGSTKYNYIGKSNRMGGKKIYSNEDEYFKGNMFDFRGYNTILSEKLIKKMYTWGKKYLGLDKQA